MTSPNWLALVIGNSRLHWARFVNDSLSVTWDEPHWDLDGGVEGWRGEAFRGYENLAVPLWIASVVPQQSQVWASYPNAQFLTLADVPLQGMYPTFGIDRALALWGAIATIGSPVLVIDCGTALTFTCADADHRLVGGAILPGLRLQFESLGQKTAQLPVLPTPHSLLPTPLPPRWSLNTEAAIASGILHTTLSGIQSFVQDWWQHFPAGNVVMTGGDSDRLFQYLQHVDSELAIRLNTNPHIIFKGIQAIRRSAQE